MNDDLLLQAYARLTAHEFMLEVMYANWFASIPEATARQISSELQTRMRRAYSAPNAVAGAANIDLQIAADAATMADRFLVKVAARGAEIRARSIQAPYLTR